MKKVTMCVCIFLLLLVLTACEPDKFYFDYDELKESVVRVEYIYYDNPNATTFNEFLANEQERLLPFDFEKMEVREVLSDEKLDDFFKDLSEYDFKMGWKHLDSPQGDSIRIVYENGDFEVLCCAGKNWKGSYSGSFYANGEVKRFIGWGIVPKFMEKWFDL